MVACCPCPAHRDAITSGECRATRKHSSDIRAGVPDGMGADHRWLEWRESRVHHCHWPHMRRHRHDSVLVRQLRNYKLAGQIPNSVSNLNKITYLSSSTTFHGTSSGTFNGTSSGTINGTSNGTLNGTSSGTLNGTSSSTFTVTSSGTFTGFAIMASSDSSVDLATIDTLELLGDNSAANWHSYAHSVEPVAPPAPTGPAPDEPGPKPESPGDPPSFAPDDNNPQSVKTAIRAYRTTLNDQLRRQLHYEDDKRTYDDAAARYREYQAQLTTYSTRFATYTTDIAAWRIADRRALAILLATIPSSLKQELSPTSSSHLWQLLVDLFDR
ncbi:unnamed protein product [Closterium sp. NIES-53]